MNKKLILLITLIPYINGAQRVYTQASEEQIGTIEMARNSQAVIKQMIATFKTEKASQNRKDKLMGLLENLSSEYCLYKAYYLMLKHNSYNLEGLVDPEILCENYAQLQSFYTPDQINFK